MNLIKQPIRAFWKWWGIQVEPLLDESENAMQPTFDRIALMCGTK